MWPFRPKPEKEYKKGLEYFRLRHYAEAFPYLIHASEAGEARAYLMTGYCYDKGKGVPQSFEKALYWYEKAIYETGSSVAMLHIASNYRDQEKYDLALTYSKMAEKAGNTNGALLTEDIKVRWFNKAYSYYERKQYHKAFQEFLKGAENDVYHSCYWLGNCYFLARGTEENLEEALRWYLYSAEHAKDPASMAAAARVYILKHDYTSALSYAMKAKAHGYRDAEDLIDAIYQIQNGAIHHEKQGRGKMLN